MKVLGNIIWLIFGGFGIAMEYFTSSILLMITIVGIPFGLQTMKIGILSLWPFGSSVTEAEGEKGCLSAVMNVLWFFIGGIWICLSHFILGILFCITVVGIPFGKQHFKLAHIAITPFGRDINIGL